MSERNPRHPVLVASQPGAGVVRLRRRRVPDQATRRRRHGLGPVVRARRQRRRGRRDPVDLRRAERRRPDGRAPRREARGRAACTGQTALPVLMLDIPAAIFDAAYNGIANSVLWFVHHMLFDTPNQPASALEFRARLGRLPRLQRGVRRRAGGATPAAGTRVLIQDYHLAPRRPGCCGTGAAGARIAHFSHTPGRRPSTTGCCPTRSRVAILDGMLGADHAGFLADAGPPRSSTAARRVLGAPGLDAAARAGAGRVSLPGPRHRRRRAPARALTHGGAAGRGPRRPRTCGPTGRHRSRAGWAAEARQLIVRVDRTELSKNIVRGLAAYRELLATRPRVARPGRAPGLRLPVPLRRWPSTAPTPSGCSEPARGDQRGVRHPRLAAADPRGQGRLPAVAGRLRGRRRAAGQPDQGRHEPGGRGGPDAVAIAAARSCCPARRAPPR